MDAYIILQADGPEELTAKVNTQYKLGYKPLGGVAISNGRRMVEIDYSESYTQYFQAMLWHGGAA